MSSEKNDIEEIFTHSTSVLNVSEVVNSMKEHGNTYFKMEAIEHNPNYVKPRLRRAQYFENSEKFDEALEDYQHLYKIGHDKAKLKDLGNFVLKPFGLSTDNFQLNKNPDGEGYSINFKK